MKIRGAVQVFVGVGSNLSPERNLPAALAALAGHASVQAVSTVYITEPIDRPEQPWYRNAVWAATTALAPEALVATLKQIEASLGRTRSADRFASRTIDLDLLLYGEEALPHLDVPANDIWERAFVACPLAELAPTLRARPPDRAEHRRIEEPIELVAARLESAQGRLCSDPELTQTLRAYLDELMAHK